MPEEVTWEHAVEATKRVLRFGGPVVASMVVTELGNMLGPQTDLGGPVGNLVDDALHYVVRRGIARFDMGHTQLLLTEHGRQSLESVEWLEADQYVAQIRAAAGDALDDTIATYLREAKRAHEEGLSLSCAVTLGCASEKAILLLAEAAHPYLGSQRLAKMVTSSRVEIGRLFERLHPRLKQYRDEERPNIECWEELEDLAASFYQFRRHRNDSGHPTGRTPDHGDLTAFLANFKSYARTVVGLTDYFKALDSEDE